MQEFCMSSVSITLGLKWVISEKIDPPPMRFLLSQGGNGQNVIKNVGKEFVSLSPYILHG